MWGGERERTRKWLVMMVEVGKEEVWRADLLQISVGGGEAVGDGVWRVGGREGLEGGGDGYEEKRDEMREVRDCERGGVWVGWVAGSIEAVVDVVA